jgi:hypothetical protein
MSHLLRSIRELRDSIADHPEYSYKVHSEVTGSIIREAQRHSLGLELASEGRCLSRKDRKIFEGRLDSAWNFLVDNDLDTINLAELGYLIEPDDNLRYFRRSDVAFGGFNPPNWERVDRLVDNLVYRLKNTIFDPVLKAIEAHIELVRIHPYKDGNGRASRLIQGYLLFEAGYPPPIIHVTDRELYLQLLGGVLRDRYDRQSTLEEPSTSEKLFRTFIASKVYGSLDRLNFELQQRRMYSIRMVTKDARLGKNVASRLRTFGRRIGIPISVNICPRNNGGNLSLNVTGDIGRAQLRAVVSRALTKPDVSFRIYKMH